MSHQSGITASDVLREKFAQIKDHNSHTRLLTVVIEHESLVPKEQCDIEGSFNEDFDQLLNSLVKPDRSCYYFIRLDTTNETGGSNWLLITWISEDAKACTIRHKYFDTLTNS
ncbi:unnamed protein product [Didymodactylos carnosus]|uniref:ADF-H domain-containing protein n=1 Tax=Didymodactylos carnosus TaxID=1234261 RepID=A0A814QTZ4_9BILA|nr:unnamed protein product [Didymodactylos carnosus]CAF1186049.1 unnamed protein product [Didymodactylos carnosus]CAF3887871.1 unnamed protein product [Didymodactylos carnosus]CAF3997092.1 unnamed protein product [Didymodactylos carnosus]